MSWKCSGCGCTADDKDYRCPVCNRPQPDKAKKNEESKVQAEVEYEWYIDCPHCHKEKCFSNEADSKKSGECPYCHRSYGLKEPERRIKQAQAVPMCLHFQVLSKKGAPAFLIDQSAAEEKEVVLGREGDVEPDVFPNTVGRKHCKIGHDERGWYIVPDAAHRTSIDSSPIIEKSYLNVRKPFCLQMADCSLHVALHEVKQKA